jgi:hypothetical protein
MGMLLAAGGVTDAAFEFARAHDSNAYEKGFLSLFRYPLL